MRKLYTAFGVHEKGNREPGDTMEHSRIKLSEVNEFLASHIANAKEVQGIQPEVSCNGPQGTISNKTKISCNLLLQGMESCERV